MSEIQRLVDEAHGSVPDVDGEYDGALPPGTAFRILADERRRFVLYLLVDRGGTVPVAELADLLAGRNGDDGAVRIDSGMPSRVHRRLYHNHLPRLAERDVVDYDPGAETVTLTEFGEKLEPYLEFAKERERDAVRSFLDRAPESDR